MVTERGIDQATLQLLEGRIRRHAVLHSIEPMQGGASSLTLLAELGHGPDRDTAGQSVSPDCAVKKAVIKLAPAGVAPTGNRDVLRQARILRALGRTGIVPVPEVLFEDIGLPPQIPPFFAMSFVDGQSFEPHIDPLATGHLAAPAPQEIHARALHAMNLLALQHTLSASDLGIREQGVVSLGEEIHRWSHLFETVDEQSRGASIPVLQCLLRKLPQSEGAALVHGDFRLGNMLCRRCSVLAVVDWEIWTLSDPRLDVAWFLLTADPATHPLAVRDQPGMPRPETLLAVYERAVGRQLPNMHWFRALCLYKMAAAVALIVKHAHRKGTDTEKAARLEPRIATMLSRAEAVLAT